MKKFKMLTYIVLAGATLALTGCGNNDTGITREHIGDEAVARRDGSHLNFAIVTDMGGVGDRSFNQSAWEGLQVANEHFGVGISYTKIDDENYLEPLETLVEGNNEIIFGIGFRTAGAIEAIARQHPNQNFIIIDYVFSPVIPNVTHIIFNDHEASYLVGYIAGSMTQTNRVGFIGGIQGVVLDRFEYGFRAGVASSNPNARVDVQYANSFVDQEAGKTIATNMYRNGADIVFHAAGDVGMGVVEAAIQEEQWVIGVDRDQVYLSPRHTLTSTMKNIGTAIYGVIEAIVYETFEPQTTMEFGLFNGGVGIAPTSRINVPIDIVEEVRGPITNQIISGDRFVPSNAQEFQRFMSAL
jgi:basic membrane protein A and related proteins